MGTVCGRIRSVGPFGPPSARARVGRPSMKVWTTCKKFLLMSLSNSTRMPQKYCMVTWLWRPPSTLFVCAMWPGCSIRITPETGQYGYPHCRPEWSRYTLASQRSYGHVGSTYSHSTSWFVHLAFVLSLWYSLYVINTENRSRSVHCYQ